MKQILLLQNYFEDTKIESIELFSMHNKNEDQISEACQKNTELEKIQNTLEMGEKEMKGIALVLCQWKDGQLLYKEKKFGFGKTKASERPLYHNATIIGWPDMEGQQELWNWSADYTTGRK